MDINGFKWDLFLLPLEPMVINFTCDYSLVCILPRCWLSIAKALVHNFYCLCTYYDGRLCFHRCVSVQLFWGGGGGTHSQVWMGLPHPADRVVPQPSWWGYPIPGLDRWFPVTGLDRGYPIPGLDRGALHSADGGIPSFLTGGTPSQV